MKVRGQKGQVDSESMATQAKTTNIFKEEGNPQEIQSRSEEGSRIKRGPWDVIISTLFMTLRRLHSGEYNVKAWTCKVTSKQENVAGIDHQSKTFSSKRGKQNSNFSWSDDLVGMEVVC